MFNSPSARSSLPQVTENYPDLQMNERRATAAP